MAMDQGTAFFHFGDDAGEAAARITAAMRQIQAAVNMPLTQKEILALDTGGMGTMIGRVESELNKGKQQINKLMSNFAAGDINMSQLQEQYRGIVRARLGAIPMAVADTLSMTSPSVLQRVDLTGAAGVWGTDFVREFNSVIESAGLGYTPKMATFMKDIERVAATPIGGASSPYAAAKRMEFLEGIVRENKSGLKPPPVGATQAQIRTYNRRYAENPVEQMIDRLGIRSEIDALRRDPRMGPDPLTGLTGIVQRQGKNGTGKFAGFVETGVRQQVKEIEAARREALSAAYAQNREFDKSEQGAKKQAQSETQLKDALRARANEQRLLDKVSMGDGAYAVGRGRIVEQLNGLNTVWKNTPDGMVEDTKNGSRRRAIQEMQDQQVAIKNLADWERNYQKVVAEGRALSRGANPSLFATGIGDARQYYERVANTPNAFREITDEQRLKTIRSYDDRQMVAQADADRRAEEVARQRALRDAQKNSGLLGGAMGRLHRNELNPLANIGSQIMSAGMFSLAYGSIFALGGALADTTREFIDYQDSMTDLQVATRSTDMVTGEWINTLSELSRLSGSNVGTALDTAARGVRAFGDVMGSSRGEIEAIGNATATAATQIALIASKDMKDATGDAIAIGTAFELEPDQLNQVVDSIANAKRNLGGDPAQIAQGLSLIAGAAREAGFNLDEAASLISLVQARTDQSGQAIATRWSRVFQIMSGSTGKALGREMGIDTNQSVKDQILQLAAIYETTNSEAVKDRITSAMGGTANLREILPILKESDRFMAAYGAAVDNAGQGTSEFERKSDNMVGTLKKISGTIRNIQVDLARADIFAPIGAGIKVLEPALHGLDRLLRMVGSLPDWATVPAAIGVDALLLAKGVSMVQARSGLFGKAAGEAVETGIDVGGEAAADAERVAVQQRGTAALAAADAERVAVENRGTAALAAADAERVAAGRAGTAATGAGGIKGGFAAIGRGLTNPWVLGIGTAVGILYGINRSMEAYEQRQGFLARNLDGMAAFGRIDGSANSIEQAAADLRAAAGDLKNKDATDPETRGVRDTVVRNLKSRARGLDDLAAVAAAEERLAAETQDLTVFGDDAIETVDELGNGLNALAASGETALTQMRLLYKALDTPPEPGRNVQRYAPAELFSEIIGAMFDDKTIRAAIPEGVKGWKDKVVAGSPVGPGFDVLGTGTTPGIVETLQEISPEEAFARIPTGRKAINRAMDAVAAKARELGLQKGDPISDEQIRQLQQAALATADLSELPEHAAQIRQQWLKTAMNSLFPKTTGQDSWRNFFAGAGIGTRADRMKLLNGKGGLTEEQAMTLLNPSENGDWQGLFAYNQAALQDIRPGDDGTQRAQVLRSQLRQYKSMATRIAKKGGNIPALNLEIERTEYDLAQTMIDRIERERRHLQNQSGLSKKEIRNLGVQQLEQEILAADGFTDLLIDIMNDADKKSLEIVRKSLERAAQLANAAALAMSAVTMLPPAVTPQQETLDAFEEAMGGAAPAPKDSKFSTGSDANLPDDKSGSGGGDKLTAAQKAAMAQQASIDPDRTVASAQAALAVAKADQAAAKGFQEKNAAMQAVVQAQDALDKAMASYAGAAAAVAGARTNSPIIQARGQIAAAAAQMRASAKGTESYLTALASFYQAQWQMREAVLAYKANVDLLKGDMTDPVEQARDALRAARRRLSTDRRNGAGADVLAQDKVDARQSEVSLQQAKWDQKLSDMKIAEQLGNISFQQYVGYLRRESTRMHAMNNKTRAQIDHMNDIDMELKSATEQMEGMWNFGDINTRGMAYQMRRYVEQQKKESRATAAAQQANRMQSATQTLQTVEINIDGADIAKIRKVLDDLLGKRVRTTQSRRR